MPGVYEMIVEGGAQILVAIILFATVYRRGKNPYLFGLACFFVAMGMLGFFPILATRIESLLGKEISDFYLHLVYHIATFFGMAGFVTVQLIVLFTPKILKKALVGTFLPALALLIIHILPLEIFQLGPEKQTFFNGLSDWTMFGFFVISLTFVAVVLLALLIQLQRSRPGVHSYAITVLLGVNLMISGLIIKKTMDAMPGYPFSDILLSIALILGVAGFVLQISLIVSPGIIFDSETRSPIQLAIVRVFSEANKKIIESKVSGQDGRYELFLGPGEYKLTIIAPGYKFPSKRRIAYHGEVIKIKRPLMLGLDIPLDPSR